MLKKKYISVLLAASMLLLTVNQAWAEETEKSAAPNDQINIKLQLDNDSMTVNGKEQQIEKPYLSNDTTLVPLRVITASFGATISWDSATQEIGLKYGEHSIQLFIGQTEAVVDGETVELPTAPELTNGTTMVPLRFISETFGANVSFDPETSQVTITGTKLGASHSGIDVDVGKTRIGDSYYGWSMKYPAGLVKTSSNFREDYNTFTDAEGEYRLTVGVEELDNTLSKDGLLKKIADYADGETVLDKKYLERGTSGYARIVAKYGDFYREFRGYTAKDRLYYLIMTVNKEEDYKNPAKSQAYTDLLDSFQTSFDFGDKALKDLSTVQNGFRKYTDDDFGISFNVPAEWYKSNDKGSISFHNRENNESVSVRITSIVDGDSLEKWVNRQLDDFTETIVSDYRKLEPVKELEVSGIPAKQVKLSVLMGDSWMNGSAIYLFKGKYKYEISFSKEKGDLSDSFISEIISSFSIDQDKMNSSLGYIQDDQDFVDRSKRTTIKRKLDNYSIEIPEYWKEAGGDDHTLVYSIESGGLMIIAAQESKTMIQLRKELDAYLESKKSVSTNYKQIYDGAAQIGGASGQVVEFQDKEKGVEIRGQVYIFEHNGIGYEIVIANPFATDTKETKKIIDDTVKSFQFLTS